MREGEGRKEKASGPLEELKMAAGRWEMAKHVS
jgi:hypothetical protein